MEKEKEQALHDLGDLGFKGRDVYLAELVPVVEMAWADGVIAPNEQAVLETWSGNGLSGEEMRSGMLEWAEAVAAVDGSPVWDTRELFWLQTMKRNFGEKS